MEPVTRGVQGCGFSLSVYTGNFRLSLKVNSGVTTCIFRVKFTHDERESLPEDAIKLKSF